MKILLIDALSPNGHKNYNKLLINIIKKEFKIYFLSKRNYIDDIESVNFLEIPEKFFKNESQLLFRIDNFKKLIWIKNNINFKEYDRVIFTGYETISMSIFSQIFNFDSRIFLINHNNLDDLNNKIKYFLFKNINEKYSHIVLEEYFKNKIKDRLKNKIYVLHHPNNFNVINRSSDIKDIIFCPSLNNDRKIILELIEKSKVYNDNTRYEIIMKSRDIKYIDNKIKIYDDYISNDKYNTLFDEAKIIYLPYEDSFNLRVSSILFEAILRKKIVITNKLGYFKMIKENYYDNIYFVDTIDELIITINSDIKFNQIDNKKFYSNFNDNKIIEQFKKIVHNNTK